MRASGSCSCVRNIIWRARRSTIATTETSPAAAARRRRTRVSLIISRESLETTARPRTTTATRSHQHRQCHRSRFFSTTATATTSEPETTQSTTVVVNEYVASNNAVPAAASKNNHDGVHVNLNDNARSTNNNNSSSSKTTTSTVRDGGRRLHNNPEHSEPTALVDGLLSYTRELMNAGLLSPPSSSQSSDNSNSKNGGDVHVRHIVAFSGGIDSSLVLALLQQASTTTHASSMMIRESVHAVMGRSPAVPQDQVALARQVANHIGIPLVEVPTTEGTDETYIANTGQACLACKTHLYSALKAVAEHAVLEDAALSYNVDDHHDLYNYCHQLYNGTNADDVQDTTRVGLIAARNFQVQSPLLFTPKSLVRLAAKHLGLPNYNVAASPCLRSRLALGVAATRDHLQRIEMAEQFVRHQLGHDKVVSETTNLRVRLLANNRAMLEIDAELLDRVQSLLLVDTTTPNHNNTATTTHTTATTTPHSKSDWQDFFVQTLGFASIHARAFRSGCVAAAATPAISNNHHDEKDAHYQNQQQQQPLKQQGMDGSSSLREAAA